MSKFKPGDYIEAIQQGAGFEWAEVLGTFISEEKRTKGKEMYRLKILCGTATVPVSAEVNYRKSDKVKRYG